MSSKAITGTLLAIAIVFTLGMAFTFVMSSQNKAITLEEHVVSCKSDINVDLKRRQDLLYNLADAVKEYDEHESEVLHETIAARGGAMSTKDVNLALGVVHEKYPELKSIELYKNLMTEIAMTENKIERVRKTYNTAIKEYNRYIRKFPTSTFLDITGYEKQNFEYLEFNAPEDAPRDLFVKQSKARDEYNANKNK